ncbi:RNA polymerase sigma24 factor [Leifsonia sp. LS1]|uniref:RNA polymerase sigma factor SigJ n=1 Tax=unclassified Leifsonia TaxID=2663824 RepID=UPI001CBAE205|nr:MULTISPECIES: RNA polymerase sigma factor SigJ [unclassified Leifsonia]UAJ79237.1 RNA polymerase sigma factor SigJ [Leifsonia sp. ZF2019]GIT78776.1 RNA polymerase sigma24 factor [Leifsonia sp. LS1]
MGVDMDAEVIAERRHLLALGYRMLGTVAEAEDAVQETYARWYRLAPDERAAIASPRAWLTRVASRVCLDVLGSARVRRESYVGPWLPEPVPSAAFGVPGAGAPGDPLDRVTLDDSVSSALLVVLEAMTPAERVAFVLHDVFALPFDEIAAIVGRSPAACRQLAASARRRVATRREREVPRAEHDRVVQAFGAAAAGGDLVALIAVLDPEAVLTTDGGGRVSAARRPVLGAENVARFLLGLAVKYPESVVAPQQTADGLGFEVRQEGVVTGILTFTVHAGLVTEIRMMRNPEKLTLWG